MPTFNESMDTMAVMSRRHFFFYIFPHSVTLTLFWPFLSRYFLSPGGGDTPGQFNHYQRLWLYLLQWNDHWLIIFHYSCKSPRIMLGGETLVQLNGSQTKRRHKSRRGTHWEEAFWWEREKYQTGSMASFHY